MDTKGGRFNMTVNGRVLSGRAKATFETALISLENGANQDGSGYSTVKPKLAKLDLTFDRGKLKWTDAMLLETVDVTFTETDLNPPVVHLMTGARWSGTPSLDTETGEVSGLSLESDKYQWN